MNHQYNGNREGHAAFANEDPDIGEFLDSAISEGKAYFDAQRDFMELQAYEQVGKAAGGMFSALLSALMILMFLLFASVALALGLGTMMGSLALGFLVVGAIYLLAFVVIHFIVRTSIRDSLMLNVVNSFYDDKD